MRCVSVRRAVSLAIVGGFVSVALAAQLQEHGTTTHRHPEAQKLTNPVAAGPESLAAGQRLYDKNCSECHGDTGKGDGMMGEDLTPPPANLTDESWKHGSSDGEIYVVIRDGTTDGMKKFGGKLTQHEIWDLINYVRTLGPPSAKSR